MYLHITYPNTETQEGGRWRERWHEGHSIEVIPGGANCPDGDLYERNTLAFSVKPNNGETYEVVVSREDCQVWLFDDSHRRVAFWRQVKVNDEQPAILPSATSA